MLRYNDVGRTFRNWGVDIEDALSVVGIEGEMGAAGF